MPLTLRNSELLQNVTVSKTKTDVENFGNLLHQEIQGPEMKNCKRDEMHFAEISVSRQCELCQRAKPPFEVSKKNIRKRQAENDEIPDTSQQGVS